MTVELRGLIPPLCTPLTPEGAVDVDSLRSLVEFQLNAGASGVFVLGSSGEAIYLDDADRLLVATEAARAVAGRVPLLVGALAPTASRVAQQCALLAGAEPDAVVVTGPFYAQLSPAEVKGHFRMAADAAGRPVVAYDIPGNTGYKLPADVLTTLLSDGVLAGVKDSSGDLSAFAALAARLGPDRTASVMSGADTQALDALRAGADGLVPGLSNVRPRWFTALLAEPSGPRAEAYQAAITALNAIFRIGSEHGVGRHASEIGAMKHLLVRDGVIAAPRSPSPLSPYPEPARAALFALVDGIDRHLATALATIPEGKSRV